MLQKDFLLSIEKSHILSMGRAPTGNRVLEKQVFENLLFNDGLGHNSLDIFVLNQDAGSRTLVGGIYRYSHFSICNFIDRNFTFTPVLVPASCPLVSPVYSSVSTGLSPPKV